ncbi:TetR/AcrR family transcriptional regulator [Streptomyces sparsogenes]|uniref:TetR/AcrR family transcriptional regulator n=1 Tax=Streptomyces sparsogenes TaxID=67365 RepID=UPI0033273D20
MTRPPARPRRADALRNYERLLAAAAEAFAEHGPQAPLDDIARAAGVGNATLYRHFPTRQALLEAVYHDHIQSLCRRAEDLASAPQPAAALMSWLKGVVAQGSAAHGLAASLMAAMEGPAESWCRKAVSDAGAALLARAQEAGEIRIDITVRQLLKLVNAIALATEDEPKPEEADLIFDILLNGLRTPSGQRAEA